MDVPKLTTMLKDAKEEDLKKLEKEIETKQNEVDGLKELAKLIRTRLYGKPQRRRYNRKDEGTDEVTMKDNDVDEEDDSKNDTPVRAREQNANLEDKIVALLKKHGPMTASALGSRTGHTPQSIGIFCNKSIMFDKRGDGKWTLLNKPTMPGSGRGSS